MEYTQTEFEDIVLKSVRTLTNSASEDLKTSLGIIYKMKDDIEEYEADSEINLQRPMDALNIPVPMKMTSDMVGHLDEILNIAEKIVLALEIAEMAALENTGEVKNYVFQIANAYKENSLEIDSLIKKYAHGWDLQRLVKIDKDILRIAISELMFIEGVPMKVVIDEALELAKKYSTDDSSSFINGILGKVVDEIKSAKKA